MKYLFVHQNFPGQFLHLLLNLATNPKNTILFITETSENNIAGVQKFCYQKPQYDTITSQDAMEFEMATRRARIVENIARRIRDLGFTPDIIIGHHGWGELLNMQDVWPGVPLLGYFEFYYHDRGLDVGFDPEFPQLPGGLSRVRVKNAVNLMALNNPGHGQTPTQFQLSTYPDWAQEKISLLREGVYLDLARPRPEARTEVFELGDFRVEPTDTLVTYVARDLEPYRGFHTMMRAIPRLHRLRPNLKIIMVGGDGVSYGARLEDGTTWRDFFMREITGVIDHSRVHFPGRIPYESFIRLLQRSDAHVYMTYPFVLSWSLREALACGCAIIGSDTAPVSEFITHRQNGYLVKFPDAMALADGITEVLETPKLAARLRRNARAWAEKNLSMSHYLDEYKALLARLIAAR